MSKIETEFDVTDRAFLIHKNQIIKAEIVTIDIKVTFEGYDIVYSINTGTQNLVKKTQNEVYRKLDDIVEKFKEDI